MGNVEGRGFEMISRVLMKNDEVTVNNSKAMFLLPWWGMIGRFSDFH